MASRCMMMTPKPIFSATLPTSSVFDTDRFAAAVLHIKHTLITIRQTSAPNKPPITTYDSPVHILSIVYFQINITIQQPHILTIYKTRLWCISIYAIYDCERREQGGTLFERIARLANYTCWWPLHGYGPTTLPSCVSNRVLLLS